MLVGYMRVSTEGDRQVLDLQRDALLAAGVDERHLYEDHASGSRGDRAGLTKALTFLRPGDCLVVWKLDRLGRSLPHLLATVNDLKERVRNRTITVDEMRDYTFTLSNFGTMAGRYATPLVTPPTVAILGVGKVQRDVIAGASAPEIHMRLPLSLTFDHRCSTGGEACRFLGAVMADLALAT